MINQRNDPSEMARLQSEREMDALIIQRLTDKFIEQGGKFQSERESIVAHWQGLMAALSERVQLERETLIAERDDARAAEEAATRVIMKDAAERERPRIQLAAAEAEVIRLSSQLAGLRTASEAFLAKWPLVLTKINGVFALQQVRSGVSYKGPTIGAEIDALTAALAAASEERDTTTE